MQGKSASIARGWLMIWGACGLSAAACVGKVGSDGEGGAGGGVAAGGHAGTSASADTTGAAGNTGAAGKSGGAAGTSAGAASGAAGTSGGAMVNPPPGQGFFVGANFWNIDWEGQNDYFQSGVNFATTTNPWLPQLLTDVAPYHVLRFMDWNQTNTSNNPQAVWSTRKQKTAQQNEPVAFEWQIDLCNRTMKDYWVNIPHEANAAYWTQLAQLISAQLNPSLRVYVEWSNEVWNSAFPQSAYATTQGTNLKLAGNDPSSSYYAYQAVRVFEAFEAVFGKGSPRLVKVMAGQASYSGPCMDHAIALGNATINPNGTKPDVYAVAPYVTGTSVAALTSGITTTKKSIAADVTCATQIGVPLVAYEAGSDSSAASSCQTVQVDPGMHDVYTAYLDAMSGAGFKGPFMQYTHSGSCWGLKVATSDAVTAAPKYQGLLDWLAAHP
jgi:hypothetical protein